MKFLGARATKYRSIEDSGWVDAEDVLALVGKNESGKTTFLQALERLNSSEPSRASFDPVKDYPRRELTKYLKVHEQNPATVIQAKFELSDEEIAQIEAAFGKGALSGKTFTVSKDYKNVRTWSIPTSEGAAIRYLAQGLELPSEVQELVKKAKSISGLVEQLEALGDPTPSTTKFAQTLKEKFPKGLWYPIVTNHLEKMLPRFVYFGDYFLMKGIINIENLAQRIGKPDKIKEADRTFLALLRVADAKLEDFLSNGQGYESLKAKLEGASASISDQVFEYWTQNKQLQVEFDVMQGNANEEAPFNSGTNLHVRIRNDRHRVTVPFDERSRGFVWFFSFLAYFSELEGSAPGSLVLLLDEPGLSLHGKAQGDLLRFIDEKLASKYQVLYTTHSPFMIAPGKFERIRTVQDVDGTGTLISKDVLKNDKDTIFPLQAALGYEIAQTLFVGPNNLLVEGPSDLIYLQLLTRKADVEGHASLSPAWTIVPVSGADKVASFVSLFGANNLNLAVLMDVSAKDKQRIDNLKANALLGRSSLIQINEATGGNDADFEDIFDPDFYLELVSGAYDLPKPITVKDLPVGSPRIVKRVEEHFKANGINGGHFNHYLPAEFLLREQSVLMGKVDTATLKRAEILFLRANGLLPGQPGVASATGAGVGKRPTPSKGASPQSAAAPMQ